jgi:hypothetical protein
VPTFRVCGNVSISFIHEVEAPSREEAEKKVENTRLDSLDNWDFSDGENTIYDVIELDADGNEVE